MIWRSHPNSTLQIHILPAFEDNYFFLIQNLKSNTVGVVDPGDAKIVESYLTQNQLHLNYILITHHHYDHIDGVPELVDTYKPIVYGPSYDKHRLPPLDHSLSDNDVICVNSIKLKILHTPGHTTGHIVYFLPEESLLFCGDTLFLMGCGRLFEGAPKDMLQSLARLKNLPHKTHIFCAHEYTRTNSEFAQKFLPHSPDIENRYRFLKSSSKKITLPGLLSEELKTNPFLLTHDLDQFTNLRNHRNNW